MAESKCEKVPYAEHPERCEANGAVTAGNQCWFFRVPGSKHCLAHGGHWQQKKNEDKALTMYRLTQFQGRLDEMCNGDKVLGLRDEIGIARTQLEVIWNACSSAADLMMNSQKINTTIQLIGKLVVDAKKLESSLGHLLDKSTVNNLCDRIVAIIGLELGDMPGAEDKLIRIGGAIGAAVEASIMQRVNADESKTNGG